MAQYSFLLVSLESNYYFLLFLSTKICLSKVSKCSNDVCLLLPFISGILYETVFFDWRPYLLTSGTDEFDW